MKIDHDFTPQQLLRLYAYLKSTLPEPGLFDAVTISQVTRDLRELNTAIETTLVDKIEGTKTIDLKIHTVENATWSFIGPLGDGPLDGNSFYYGDPDESTSKSDPPPDTIQEFIETGE